ncbi:uncharacterized protein LOC129741349 [Uranotaenia lowii]|uniref:uncharacterized protein LOC129741349 n=1 Tax=Uranotaenia lowii TaxID=190385 RepID=UPI00247940F8|nr:uncharacterized protein LOC129741349 [Uranotaenia lowii]
MANLLGSKVVWIGFEVILLVTVIVQVDADFGLRYRISGGKSVRDSAKSLNAAIDTINKDLLKYQSNQTEVLEPILEAFNNITGNVTTFGRSIVVSINKAVRDRRTPVDELFANLNSVYAGMSRYLSDDVEQILEPISSSLGANYTKELQEVLGEVKGAVQNVSITSSNVGKAVARMSSVGRLAPNAINSQIPSTLTDSLSDSLMQLEAGTMRMSQVMTRIIRDVGAVQTFVRNVVTTEAATDPRIAGAIAALREDVEREKSRALGRYEAMLAALKTDLIRGTNQLPVFFGDRQLLKLVEKYSEEYTKSYYVIYNRKEEDRSKIVAFYDSIPVVLSQLVEESNHNISVGLQRSAQRLVDRYVKAETNGESCFNKFVSWNRFLFPFQVVQDWGIACANKERVRLRGVGDLMDAKLILINYNSGDLAASIGTCGYHSGFTNPEIYTQAKSCLQTNLKFFQNFNEIILQELVDVEQLLQTETEATRFRLTNCFMTRSNEASAFVDHIDDQIDSCLAGNDTVRGLQVVDAVEEIELSTLKSDNLDEYDELDTSTVAEDMDEQEP